MREREREEWRKKGREGWREGGRESSDYSLSSLYQGLRGGAVFSGAATQSLCCTATHSCGQEEVERQKFKPCDAITAADAMELNSLVVIDVKPAILSNSKQRFRMQKPGRRGGVAQ